MAPHLVQESPGRKPFRIPVRGDILIGRGSDCHVTLQDDMVSRHHARVSLDGDRVILRDLGSTNGTTLDGAKVTVTDLKVRSCFTIGRSKFTLVDEPPSPGVAPPPPPPPGAGKTKGDLDATASFSLPEKKPGLVVTDGAEGSVFETRSDLNLDAEPTPGSTKALTLEEMAGLSKRLAALNKIGAALANILEVEHLLDEVISQVFGLFPRADRCCILLEENGELKPVKVRKRGKPSAEDLDIRLSRTVIGLNRDDRKAVLSFDTATDQRLSAAMSIVASGIRSIMSVPIVQKDEFYGILYVDSANIGSPFTSEDLQLLASLASQMAMFVKNARLVERIEEETALRTNLGRYLSPSVVSEISRGALHPSLGGDSVAGTCLFSDIVGFTRICRNLPAAEVVSLLNQFFRKLVDAVFRYDGTVDKFGGDAMLCVWGAPVRMEDHAGPAIAAALEMQNQLYGFNLELQASDSPVLIRMGIGLNSGTFIAGNVGSEQRLEYTVIGDNVNLAQRVEEKASGGMVLVSDATRQLAKGAAATKMKVVVIRGAIGEVTVHAVRGIRRPKDKEGFLLTSIPANVRVGGGEPVESVVVALDRTPSGPVFLVRVPAAGEIPKSPALEVELLMPEAPGLPRLNGGVLGVRASKGLQGDKEPLWTDVELLVPVLPEPLDAILRAGSTWESPLSPDDIPRH